MIDLAAALEAIEAALDAADFEEADRLTGDLAAACANAPGVQLDEAAIARASEVLQRCMDRARAHRAEVASALGEAAAGRRATTAYAR